MAFTPHIIPQLVGRENIELVMFDTSQNRMQNQLIGPYLKDGH